MQFLAGTRCGQSLKSGATPRRAILEWAARHRRTAPSPIATANLASPLWVPPSTLLVFDKTTRVAPRVINVTPNAVITVVRIRASLGPADEQHRRKRWPSRSEHTGAFSAVDGRTKEQPQRCARRGRRSPAAIGPHWRAPAGLLSDRLSAVKHFFRSS